MKPAQTYRGMNSLISQSMIKVIRMFHCSVMRKRTSQIPQNQHTWIPWLQMPSQTYIHMFLMPHQTCTRFLVPGTPVGHEVPDVPVDMYKVLNVPADMYEVPDTPAAMYDHPDAPMDMYKVPIALPYMCEVPNASQDMNEVPTSPADMYMSLKMNNFN